jgi:hypothetical protein
MVGPFRADVDRQPSTVDRRRAGSVGSFVRPLRARVSVREQ